MVSRIECGASVSDSDKKQEVKLSHYKDDTCTEKEPGDDGLDLVEKGCTLIAKYPKCEFDPSNPSEYKSCRWIEMSRDIQITDGLLISQVYNESQCKGAVITSQSFKKDECQRSSSGEEITGIMYKGPLGKNEEQGGATTAVAGVTAWILSLLCSLPSVEAYSK
jgi:hypothetical protein